MHRAETQEQSLLAAHLSAPAYKGLLRDGKALSPKAALASGRATQALSCSPWGSHSPTERQAMEQPVLLGFLP